MWHRSIRLVQINVGFSYSGILNHHWRYQLLKIGGWYNGLNHYLFKSHIGDMMQITKWLNWRQGRSRNLCKFIHVLIHHTRLVTVWFHFLLVATGDDRCIWFRNRMLFVCLLRGFDRSQVNLYLAYAYKIIFTNEAHTIDQYKRIASLTVVHQPVTCSPYRRM